MDEESEDRSSFLQAVTEWVEACWFDERDDAVRWLEDLLELRPEVVLGGSMWLVARLVEAFAPADPGEVAAALAQHMIFTGPDPERETLIHEVVLAAGAAPAARQALVARRGAEAVVGTALECASFLVQALANRDGVVPSSILGEL